MRLTDLIDISRHGDITLNDGQLGVFERGTGKITTRSRGYTFVWTKAYNNNKHQDVVVVVVVVIVVYRRNR